MNGVPIAELRRLAETLNTLRGHAVLNAVLRSDLRQLRLELADGLLAVVAVAMDKDGRPRLEIDVIRQTDGGAASQLEVRFDPT
jgi:hypothetical protein